MIMAVENEYEDLVSKSGATLADDLTQPKPEFEQIKINTK